MSSGMLFGARTASSLSSSSSSPSWCVSVCVRVWVRIVTRTRTQTPANHKDDDDDDEDAEEDGFGFEVSLVSSCTSRSQEPAGHAADALCSSKNHRATKLHPCNLRRDLNNFLTPKLD